MMIKQFSANGWDFGEPVVQQIKISSDGLVGHDRKAFVKRAGAASEPFLALLNNMKRAGDEELLHLIALGATERWGPNRNGDGFDKKGSLIYHDTFVKLAKWYRNHQNKDPRQSYGIVKASAWQPDMWRIDLIVGLNKTAAAADRNGGHVADRELQKLARTGSLNVSMACVTDPAAPVLTADGYVPIADIRVGDLVHSHKGRWKRVTELNRRKYSGEIVEVYLQGLGEPLRLTADHPMYAKSLARYAELKHGQRAVAQWADEVAKGEPAFAWLHAGELQKGDRIHVCPVQAQPGRPALADTRLAELLGTYAAEGSLAYNRDEPSAVCLTVHARDWAVRGVPAIMSDLWPGITVQLEPKRNTDCAFSLMLYSAELARWCRDLVGVNADAKRIPAELLGSTEQVKLAFLGRWLDGDGFCDNKGLHWSSSNLGLILQGRDLLLSAGIPASIYRIDHAKCKTSGYAGSGIEYTLNVSNFDGHPLKAWSAKVGASPHVWAGRQQLKSKPASLYRVDDAYAYRVRSVVRRHVEDMQTYNFEVEGDHSYSLLGTSSHNCRIDNDECSWCGNRARSRDEYCTKESCAAGGCRDNLAKLVKVAGELHHLHVNNPRPQYFDISDVYRNADRTAHAYPVDYVKAAECDQLFKYAEEHGGVFDMVGGAATAEMLGLMPAMAVQFHEEDPACLWSPRVANQIKLARVLAEWEPEEPPDAWRLFDAARRPELPPLPGGLKVGEFLAALAERTVVLPFTEFARLTKRAELAAIAAPAVPGALGRMQADGTLERALERNPYVPDDGPVSEVGRKIAALVEPHYGLARRAVFARAAGSVVRDAPRLKTSFDKTAGAADLPEAERLARDYACYQVASLCKIAEHDDQFTLTCRLCACQNQYS